MQGASLKRRRREISASGEPEHDFYILLLLLCGNRLPGVFVMDNDLSLLLQLNEKLATDDLKTAVHDLEGAYQDIGRSDASKLSPEALELYADVLARTSNSCEKAIGERSFIALVVSGPGEMRSGHDPVKVLGVLGDLADKRGYTELKVLVRKLRRKLFLARISRALASLLIVGAILYSGINANSLVGKDLSGRDFRSRNFTSRDFSGAVLADTDLWLAVLTNAKLEKADLSGANLYFAKVERANLRGAKLTGADLRNANFTGADLTGADLSGASIENANFTGANLENARFDGARGRADFRAARTNGAVLPEQAQ